MKSIRQQIKDQPKAHLNYFTCLGFAIILTVIAFWIKYPLLYIGSFSFLAATFVIAAIIDAHKPQTKFETKEFSNSFIIESVNLKCKNCGWESFPGATILHNKNKTIYYCPECNEILTRDI